MPNELCITKPFNFFILKNLLSFCLLKVKIFFFCNIIIPLSRFTCAHICCNKIYQNISTPDLGQILIISDAYVNCIIIHESFIMMQSTKAFIENLSLEFSAKLCR